MIYIPNLLPSFAFRGLVIPEPQESLLSSLGWAALAKYHCPKDALEHDKADHIALPQ